MISEWVDILHYKSRQGWNRSPSPHPLCVQTPQQVRQVCPNQFWQVRQFKGVTKVVKKCQYKSFRSSRILRSRRKNVFLNTFLEAWHRLGANPVLKWQDDKSTWTTSRTLWCISCILHLNYTILLYLSNEVIKVTRTLLESGRARINHQYTTGYWSNLDQTHNNIGRHYTARQ